MGRSEASKEKQREYAKAHPITAAYHRAWYARNPDKVYLKHRNANLRKNFGISEEIYRALEISQQGECDICGKKESSTYKGKTRRLAVDHDHQTGEIRSLLCASCNVGLGIFSDSPVHLRQAIQYLGSF